MRTGGRGGCRAVLRGYIHLRHPISATAKVKGVRGARTARDNPRVRYGAPCLLSSPSPFLFHSACPGCTTHRQHLAIHLGPVLLITRLELRTRTGTAGVRETSRAFEKKGTPEHGPPRVARSRDHRPPHSPLVFVSRQLAYLSLSLSFVDDGFFIALATKGPLYAAGERVYFIRRMLFGVLASSSRSRVISRSVPSSSPRRVTSYACLTAGNGREEK